MRTLVLFSGLAAVAASAQESAISGSSAEDAVIEQIIVTATRREESVTDVPLAVSAYDAERIEVSRVTDIMELMRVAPSFHVASGQAESVGVTARIRGVGTNSDNPGLESSVGMYIDGVYRNRATVGFTELGAIERIEVLRGPQGTLFGRNSSAGVVSIITAMPDPDGSGYADISIGSYGTNRVEAGVSGGIGQDTSARLDAVLFQRDGFLEDLNYDRSFNNRDRTFVRGQVLFEPSDTVRLRLIGDYSDRGENCCAAVGLIEGPTAPVVNQIAQAGNPGTVGIAFDPYARGATVTESSGYYQSVEEGGVSLEVDADLPFARVVSVTAWRDWQTAREQDIDFSAMDMGERPLGEYTLGFETFTQELRFSGQNGPLDWLVGAYFADERLPYEDALDYGVHYSPFANGIASQAAAGIGAGFDGFRQLAQIDALEAGAAGIAQGAAGLSAGLAGLSGGLSQLSAGLSQFEPLLMRLGLGLPMAPAVPGAPTFAGMLPSFPGFEYADWLQKGGYEGISGAGFYGNGVRDSFEQESRSWALFTHNTLELQNDFDLTLGLRYTAEDKSMTANLRSSDQVCLPFSQRFLGSLQANQQYFAGVGAYAQGLQAYAAQLQGLSVPAAEVEAYAGKLRQLAGALPPDLAGALPPGLNQQLDGLVTGARQLEQVAQLTQAGAAQLLPGLPQVVAGGQQLLTDPALVGGLAAIVALGCMPFTDPTRDGAYAGALDESEATGTLRISRNIGDHLLYGGFARGYKAGGFNMDRTGLASPILTAVAGAPAVPAIDQWIFRPETVDSLELGGKFSLDDWRALLDVSVFQEEFEGYQLTAFTGFAFEALNIPEVTSRGVEIEARGTVNGAIDLFGGVTYADVRFGDSAEHG